MAAPRRFRLRARAPRFYALGAMGAWRGCGVAALVIAPAAAWAQPAPTALQWVRLPGAEACADGPTLARLVDARLGRPVFTAPSRAERLLEGRIGPRASAPGWEIVITSHSAAGRTGSRTLLADRADCAAVTPTLGLVLSLLADPDACRDGACGPAHALPGAGEATAPAVLRLLAETPPPTPPPVRAPWTVFVGGGAALLNVLPSGSVAAAVLWRPRRGPFAAELGLAGLVPTGGAPDAASPVSLRAVGGTVTALGCVSPFDDLRVAACAGLAGAVLQATARGAVEPGASVEGALAGVIRVSVQAALGDRLVARVAPSLVVPVRWPRHVLGVDGEAPRELQSPGGVGVSFEASLGWRFGG